MSHGVLLKQTVRIDVADSGHDIGEQDQLVALVGPQQIHEFLSRVGYHLKPALVL